MDIILWTERLGSRCVWDWDCVGALFYNGRKVLDWAFEDPSFIEFVSRDNFFHLSLILESIAINFRLRIMAQRFPVVLPVALLAAARKSPNNFKRLISSGALLREHRLASGGALLHAVRRKRTRLSMLKHTFALTRSDFASVGLSAAFSDDL